MRLRERIGSGVAREFWNYTMWRYYQSSISTPAYNTHSEWAVTVPWHRLWRLSWQTRIHASKQASLLACIHGRHETADHTAYMYNCICVLTHSPYRGLRTKGLFESANTWKAPRRKACGGGTTLRTWRLGLFWKFWKRFETAMVTVFASSFRRASEPTAGALNDGAKRGQIGPI
jgi:hypothetical protein